MAAKNGKKDGLPKQFVPIGLGLPIAHPITSQADFDNDGVEEDQEVSEERFSKQVHAVLVGRRHELSARI